MRTLNHKRPDKIKEIKDIRNLYPDLSRMEQMFMVLDTLDRRAVKTNDETKRASTTEIGIAFEPLFQDGPIQYLQIQANTLISQVRRDPKYPHIRPYTRPYVDTLVDGSEVIRKYVELLRGKDAIVDPNRRLERQLNGIKKAIKANQSLANIRAVSKEIDSCRQELEQKQQDANRRKRRP